MSNLTSNLFEATAVYSPVNYLPQAIGFNFAKLFRPSLFSFQILGRLVNLVVSVWLISLAINIIPIGKWAMSFMALMPTVIQEQSSLAPDASNNAVCFLLVAQYLKCLLGKEIISKKDIGLAILVCLCLGLMKPTLLPLAFIFLFLPGNRYGSKVEHIFGSIVPPIVALVSYLLWYQITKSHNLDLAYAKMRLGMGVMINPKGELINIANDPISFFKAVYAAVLVHHKLYIAQLYGLFGQFNIELPRFSLYIGYLSIFSSILINQIPTRIAMFYRIMALLCILSAFFIIHLFAYLAWTAAGAEIVDGVQGRYFIAYMPLFIIILTTNRKLFCPLPLKIFGIATTFVNLVIMQGAIYLHYY